MKLTEMSAIIPHLIYSIRISKRDMKIYLPAHRIDAEGVLMLTNQCSLLFLLNSVLFWFYLNK